MPSAKALSVLPSFRPACLALALALVPGCVKTLSDSVDLHDEPADDPEYADALEEATRAETVYANFETRYKLHATYLSPRFRVAFTRRLERIFLEGEHEFKESGAKAGFFVSLYSPVDERAELGDPNLWTILLTTPEGSFKPAVVKRLNDKERWRAFFPFLNQWSKEYLVIFDAPSVQTDSPDLVEKSSMNLVFTNADAKVSLSW